MSQQPAPSSPLPTSPPSSSSLVHRALATLCLFLVLGVSLSAAEAPLRPEPIDLEPSIQPGLISWALPAAVDTARQVLIVSGPGGRWSLSFPAGTAPALELQGPQGEILGDGSYTYELRLEPRVDEELRVLTAEARRAGDEALLEELERSGALPRGVIRSGSFRVEGGRFLVPVAEAGAPRTSAPTATLADPPTGNRGLALDDVINDDLIVRGNACVGFDCADGEEFGTDTLRLENQNLRLHFDDSSSIGSFPDNDWRLVANDSTTGGAEKFALEDASAARELLVMEAGAPANTLYGDSAGLIGLGTATPAMDLHISDASAPALRLDQNGTGTGTAQAWDLVGDDTQFALRDVTHSSARPFRVEPGAPENGLYLEADGDVGLGLAEPLVPLHLKRSDGTARILVEETNATVSNRILLDLVNNGGVQLLMRDVDLGESWSLTAHTQSDLFQLAKAGGSKFRVKGSGGISVLDDLSTNIFDITASGDTRIGPSGGSATLTVNGDIIATGTITSSSDREKKENFVPLDRQQVLEKVLGLPITTWNFKAQEAGERHLGPMAQDFHAAFGLGTSDRHIAPLDAAGVALVAVQGAVERQQAQEQAIREALAAKDAEISELRAQVEELRQLVEALGER